MKDELQLKLVEIMTSIQSAASRASDFAMAELPDIAQSYVIYGRWTATAHLAASVIIMLMGFYGAYIAIQESKKPSMQQSEVAVIFGGLMGLLASLVGFICFMACVSNFFLVWAAPKVWLLKEIARFLK